MRRSRSREIRASSRPRSDASWRPLDLFPGGDFRFAQRLDPADLELLQRPLALEPRGIHHLFAGDVRLVDIALCGDVGLFDLGVRLDPLHLLGGELDDALLVGLFDRLLAPDIDDLARLRRCDAVFLQRQLHGDALAFDLVALLDVGCFDGLVPGDLQVPGVLLGGDALRVQRLLLGDARSLDRLVGGNLRGVQSLVAGDLQIADLLVAGDLLR